MSWTSLNNLLVKEHVGMFKAANNFDIFDPSTGVEVLRCREPNLGLLTKMLRFTDFKRSTPFEIEIREPGGELVVRVKRGVTFLRSRVEVFDGHGAQIGYFQQRLLSIGGKFGIFDPQGQELCQLKGRWTGWNFQFLVGETELASVSKKWSGLGKEMFTSADNYMLSISPSVPENSAARRLILAAVMCIDMVLKE